MVINIKSFYNHINACIIACVFICFSASAQEAWVDEAIAFAETLKETQTSSPTRSVEEIEYQLSTLTPSKRLQAYQRLSFMYLVDWRLEEYKAFKALYAPLLKQYNEDENLDMQIILDLLEANINAENIDEVITTAESLIKSKVLLDESNVLAHVVLVYSRNLKRVTPQTLKAIRDARNAYALSDKSSFAGIAVELASAYTMLNLEDYAQSNKSYRAAYQKIKTIDYLYFNVNNYLSNLSWMLRQSNQLQHAIDINNSQLNSLPENSNTSYAFFVYFACGVYQQANSDYGRSLNCFESAGNLLHLAPGRWESWYAGIIITSVLAERVELAKQYLNEFMNDSRSKKQLSPLSKMHLAKAYLAIENDDSKNAIKTLNTYYVSNANRQNDKLRKLSKEYSTFIDNEIEALEKNVNLQNRLLSQQNVLNVFGISTILGLVLFTVFLLRSRKKQWLLATHDSLTGIYNRRGFLEAFETSFDSVKREGTMLALGTVDIDGFKAINDINGHAAGDAVLNTLAIRLQAALGESAIIGRMGGDEFAFLLLNMTNAATLKITTMALSESLNKEICLSNLSLKPSVSIGVSTYPETASSLQQLVDCAEFALLSCKKFEPGSVRLFNASDQSTMEAQRGVEAALANAKDDEFTLYYQAIVDAHSQEVKGFEALARWISPELGFVSPADFIPVAERTGHINKLSRLLLAKALEDAIKWPENMTLSFNLSSQDVNSIENAQCIKQIIIASGFPTSRIIAEMTETAIIQDTATTRNALNILTGIGVLIALDDFGTGYSSINHLLDFEFYRIKLDRVLIDSIENDANKFEIVKTLVEMCHNLKVDSVIEGVETNAQKDLLCKMKVDKFQGYLFSKPIPSHEVLGFLASRR